MGLHRVRAERKVCSQPLDRLRSRGGRGVTGRTTVTKYISTQRFDLSCNLLAPGLLYTADPDRWIVLFDDRYAAIGKVPWDRN